MMLALIERRRHPWRCSRRGILEGSPVWEGARLNGLGAWGNSTGSGAEVGPGLCGQQLSRAALLLRPSASARMTLVCCLCVISALWRWGLFLDIIPESLLGAFSLGQVRVWDAVA